MKKINSVAVLTLLICMVFGCQTLRVQEEVAPKGPTGVYLAKTSTPNGEVEFTMAINSDGTGLLESRMGKAEFSDAKIGVMIETPAAAILAEELLKEVDFVNIGSNDLSVYTLAVSRSSLAVEKRYHILHLSLVKLLTFIVKAGKRARREVCLCGEIASFEEFYPLFFSIGLKCFSIATPKFEYIKCHLLQEKGIDKLLLKKFYNLKTKKDIDRFFKR